MNYKQYRPKSASKTQNDKTDSKKNDKADPKKNEKHKNFGSDKDGYDNKEDETVEQKCARMDDRSVLHRKK